MHKHHRAGFTVVELLIVIIVIVIISTVTIVAYSRVQMQSRDAKRSSDVTSLINALEIFYDAAGNYPPGCPDTTCPNALHTANTSSAALTTTTTLSSVRGILSGLKDTFGDPQSPNLTYPFKNRTVNEMKYIYFGGTYNNTASTLTLDSTTHANFPCTLRSTLPAGSAGSYVVGYFSEKANKWILTGGRNGIQMTIAAGLAANGCVINRG